MRGSITKRRKPNGKVSWGYIFDGPDQNGKRCQIAKRGFEKKGEADDALAAAITEMEALALAPTPVAVAEVPTYKDYFKYWTTEHAARRCAPKTLFRYIELGQYLMKYLGGTRINELTTAQIQTAINRLEDSGGMITKLHPEGKPLSAKTVRSIGGVLYTSLAEADRLDMLKIRHPMAGKRVVLPKLRKRQPAVLDHSKLGLLFDQVRGTRLYPVIITAAATGCRRGELLSLQWSDIDDASGMVTISKSLEQLKGGHLRVKSTKSGEPRRFVIPEWALEVLKEHRVVQEGDRELYRADYKPNDLVFCQPDGSFYSPDRLGARIVEAMRKAGLAGVSMHSLRHSFASLMLSKGVPISVVSERLGHSDQNITLSIYSHAMPADSNAAAKVWNDAMKDVIADSRKAAPERMLAVVSRKAS